jgi:predicted nucleic acid-binding protein
VTLVVDASVACKWFVTETGSDAADVLLASGDTLLAPDVILPEVCNVAWIKLRRREIVSEQAAAMMYSLPDLFDQLVPSTHLAVRALDIANELGHPAYDCFYLATAELHDARMVTDDRRLLTRVRGSVWARRMIRLGDDVVRR